MTEVSLFVKFGINLTLVAPLHLSHSRILLFILTLLFPDHFFHRAGGGDLRQGRGLDRICQATAVVEPCLWKQLWPRRWEILCGHTDRHRRPERMVNVLQPVSRFTLSTQSVPIELKTPSKRRGFLLSSHWMNSSDAALRAPVLKRCYRSCCREDTSGVVCCRCVGYLFQKVGKVAATSVGGGLLLLQVRIIFQRDFSSKAEWLQLLIVFMSVFTSLDSQPHWLHQSGLEESREGRQ